MNHIKLSGLLKNFSPKHEIEQVMLVSRYSCGCVTTITFGGFLITGVRTTGASAKNKYLWCDNVQCKESHIVSFDEVSGLKNNELQLLVTEMHGFNAIKVSVELSGANRRLSHKKVA